MSEHSPPQEAHWPEGAIFTLGHSTLPIPRFLALLQTCGIDHLVDIRTIPRSRHNPQFNDTALANSLSAQHLEYLHIRALGGLRRMAHPPVHELVLMMSDTSFEPAVRKAAAQVLYVGSENYPAGEIVPGLIELLKRLGIAAGTRLAPEKSED